MKLKGKLLSALAAGTIAITSVVGSIPFMSINASAAAKEELILTSAEGAPGETVTLDVIIKCSDNFESLDAMLSWNNKNLKAEDTYISNKNVSVFSDIGNNFVTLAAFSSGPIPDGTIAQIEFTIPEDAKTGTVYNINWKEVNTFAIFDGDDICDTVSCTDGKIEVVEAMEEYFLGDVNQNGKIELQDAILIAKYLLNPSVLDERQKDLADFNNDGVVNLLDVVAVAKYLLGK